jgi:DNA-binding transcriptional regulator YhcF (GntR family)
MGDPGVGVDEADKRHASRRVAEALREQIDAGRYKPGDQLPSYRALASEHDIAVNTAQAAVRRLVLDGRVTVRPSAGAYVVDDAGGAEPTSVTVSRRELDALHKQVERARSVLTEVDRALTDLADRAGGQPVDPSDSAP